VFTSVEGCREFRGRLAGGNKLEEEIKRGTG